MNLYEHIRQLYQAELFEDLIHLFSLALSMCESSETAESGNEPLMTLSQKYQCLVYYGHALYQQGEYRKAVKIFKKSLLLRKAINKAKGKCGSAAEILPEVEVKYRLYQCHMKLKENSDALQILESIGNKQRTGKISLALARLYQQEGRDRSALTSYKEVLREHPLALVAVRELLSLGMRGTDVMSLITTSLPHFSSCDWFTWLVRAYALMSVKDFTLSVSWFRSLEAKGGLRDNVIVQDGLAEALFMSGQYSQAAVCFQRIRALDPLHLHNMDLYAFLLSRDKRAKELQTLSQHLMEVNDQAVEPWVCMGYYSLHSGSNKPTERLVRTVYCAQKAYSINPRCTQALLLKGTALQELHRMQDALLHFHEAVLRAPDRFETYQGLVDCYVASHRLRDAVTLATRAFSQLGCSARTSTLLASVLAKSPTTVTKAKPYLEKAMKLDPTFLEAVYIMADICAQEHDYDRSITLLRQALQTHNDSQLHERLANCLLQTSQYQDALEHFHTALNLDPNSVTAREGMERVEKHNEMGIEGGYDVEVEDMAASDNEPDFDGSDMESTWSETDFSQA